MLQIQTVEPRRLALLKELMQLEQLQSFRLVGGTALSLKLGHRKSIDLDLFTDQPLDIDALIEVLEENFGRIVELNNRKHINQCVIQNIKVDFFCQRPLLKSHTNNR